LGSLSRQEGPCAAADGRERPLGLEALDRLPRVHQSAQYIGGSLGRASTAPWGAAGRRAANC